MSEIAVVDIIRLLEEQLATRYPDKILQNQTAWWMLEAITKQHKAYLLAHKTIDLTVQQQQALNNWIHQQVHQHMPLQYLLGSVPFGDLEILVEPPILIPRPETEEWCMNLIEQLKRIQNTSLTILDLCSGSGCIGLALAQALPASHVYAIDIAQQAIQLGMVNAQHNAIQNITFINSDLFTQAPNITFDLIVSNPPYIPTEEWQELDLSVTKWEDPHALIADDHGLKIIKQIITQAPRYLKSNTELAQHGIYQLTIEIDPPQAQAVCNLLHDAGFVHTAITKDLEGKERIVSGSLVDVADTKDHK